MSMAYLAQNFRRSHPDDALVPTFRHHAVHNLAASAREGRPIYDDIEVVDIRAAGSRNWQTFPVTAVSHKINDPVTGEQTLVTYAERFSHQYQQFKASLQQTKVGTPLAHAPFLTDGKRAELRAQNIYTVEALATIDGAELKNLGPFGRDMKNRAQQYIDETKLGAASTQLQAELDAMRAQLETSRENESILKSKLLSGEAQFEAMSVEALRDYITSHTGIAPQGNSNKKTLIRMAMACRPRDEQQVA